MAEKRCLKCGDLNHYKNDQMNRVYSAEGCVPALLTVTGGGRETKIATKDTLNPMPDGTARTIKAQYNNTSTANFLTDISSYKASGATDGVRFRKLTENECFRLMGVKDSDFLKVKKHQSKSSLYHLAGDSIITTCLMAIFGEILGVEYKEKIKELSDELAENKKEEEK